MANGTQRSGAAVAIRQRVCEVHERLSAQRAAQWQAEVARQRRMCQGAPRVSRDVAETIARQVKANPMSLTFVQLTPGILGSCTMTVYYPQGVLDCDVSLDGPGQVSKPNCR